MTAAAEHTHGSGTWRSLLVYASAHGAVDTTCAALLLSAPGASLVSHELVGLLLLYNVLAFGLQPLFGLAVDRLQAAQPAAALGCGVIAAAVALPLEPAVAVGVAALGNALFHVGAGGAVLALTPGRATAPGIFAAPGPLGLFAGAMLGMGGHFIGWAFACLLLALGACISLALPTGKQPAGPAVVPDYLELIVVFVSLAIAARALVGASLVFPWQANAAMLAALTLAIVLGKGLGGVLADRFGWTRVAVTGLLIAAPLLACGSKLPLLGIAGMFLLYMAMPVTLAALAALLPGYPAFAFGLTGLALVIGGLPALTPFKQVFGTQSLVFAVLMIAAAALYGGLRLLPSVRAHG